MDARFYNSDEIDIERLATDLENIYRAQGYQVQQIGSKDTMIAVQLKKGGDLEKLVGMGVALSVVLQHTTGGVIAMIGQQKWVDKAAAGAVGAVGLVVPVLLPLVLTAGVGAIRQASLGNHALNMVDNLVRQQKPGIHVGPIPVQIVPQIQQQYAQPAYMPTYNQPPVYQPPTIIPQPPPFMPPAPTTLRCPSCNTPYEAGDTFCTGCGRTLKKFCPNCKTELKTDVAFCPKCGASIFQSTTARPPVSPTPQPPVNPLPAAPVQPPAPAYTPPPFATPTVANTVQATPTPTPQPSVSPIPQEPPVMPQPRVTIVQPATSKQGTPAPAQPPQMTPYTPPATMPVYTSPAQSATPKVQPAQPQKPIQPKPSNQPVLDPNAPWGVLTFSNGTEIRLSGERAVIGRVDHDLGADVNPQVDLSKMQGADTVSRIHAVIEHIGSAYTLTDLNSTNATRINGKRLEPDKATPIQEGETLAFGKVSCTFKKV